MCALRTLEGGQYPIQLDYDDDDYNGDAAAADDDDHDDKGESICFGATLG